MPRQALRWFPSGRTQLGSAGWLCAAGMTAAGFHAGSTGEVLLSRRAVESSSIVCLLVCASGAGFECDTLICSHMVIVSETYPSPKMT